jgi:hypothetical protein
MFVGMGANGAGGYNLTDSLRFRSSASAYLSRTPASSTSTSKYTLSMWVKLGALQDEVLFSAGPSSSSLTYIRFYGGANQAILWETDTSSTYNWFVQTSALYRDPSAWYHLVFAYDSSLSGVTSQAKIYVNGVQAAIGASGSLGTNSYVNAANAHYIGRLTSSALYFDGYITEVNLVDGQQLTPSDFGEYDAITGVWKPKKYTGTYGTNGFYLDMSTSGSTVTDQSGNSNNWTATNMNLTTSSATTYDKMSDVPTLTDEDTANYAVINPLNSSTTTVPTTSNANLRIVGTVNAYQGMYMSMAIPSTGKWYFEYTYETKQGLGGNQQTLITPSPSLSGSGATSDSTTLYGLYSNSNYQYGSTGQTDLGIAAVAGNTQMVAYDSDTGKLWWGYNGTWFLSGNPSAGTNPLATQTASIEKYIANVTYGTGGTTSYNFGQRPFAYTPPTGFKKLNTFNLPDSSIVDGSENMNTVLYTGNGSTQSITGVGFSPDFVWIKERSSTSGPQIHDSIRGAYRLYTNLTNAEEADSGWDSFDADGYSMLGGNDGINESGQTYVAWNWKAGGTAVTNTDGDITTLVSANPTAGFSIVTFTGTGVITDTIGHGLGTTPEMMFVRGRSIGSGWFTYHKTMGNGKFMYLNTTQAETTSSGVWNNTSPTNTVFVTGGASAGVTMVAYCFASVEGFSKIGSFVANGSADGPFVYTGFRPAFVMWKNASAIGSWNTFDTSRSPYNAVDEFLRPNTSDAESSGTDIIDLLSNGFKTRYALTNGNTYIYMAFAENPMKHSLAR